MSEAEARIDRRDFLRGSLAAATAGAIGMPGSAAAGPSARRPPRSRRRPTPSSPGTSRAGCRWRRPRTRPSWAASTDVSEAHTAAQVARNQTLNEFVGSPEVIETVTRPARPQGRARRPDRPPAREGPPPRGRGARDDPRGRQGPHRGRGRSSRPRRTGSPTRSSAPARPTSTPRPTTSTGSWSSSRDLRRAAGRLGDVQDDRPPAPRRAAAAPRPAEQGRPGDRVRRLLRAPGRRLRHDRPRDDRPLRRLRRRDAGRSTSSSTPGPSTRWRSGTRPRSPRRQDPRPLAPQPLGPELARPGRGGRHGRPLQGQDQGVHHRAGRAVLRLARLPQAAEVVLGEVRPLPGRPQVRAGRRTATPAPGTSTCATTSAA